MELFRGIYWVCLFMAFVSCTKDELTKPAPVNLQMEMGNNAAELRLQESPEASITIEKAYYNLSGVEFEGYRQTGSDYFFFRGFENGLDVLIESSAPAKVMDFDMPQGIYDRIKISLLIRRSNGKDSSSGGKRMAASSSFNQEAGLIMKGYYTNTKNEQVPLIFVYDFDETFEYTAQSSQGNTEISVDKSKSHLASIRFDASYWMQLINGRMLQSAKLTEVEGEPTIVLSEDQNEHIFNLLVSRIKNASELTFK